MKTTTKMTMKMAALLTVAMVTALVGGPRGLEAQEVRPDASESCQIIGTIGVSGWSCRNCAFNWSNGVYRGNFTSEPMVDEVDPSGPAAGVLRPGDRIVAVDGHLISSAEGGRALMDMDPGDAVRVRFRRDGRDQEATITAGRRCAPVAPRAPEAPMPTTLVPPTPETAPRASRVVPPASPSTTVVEPRSFPVPPAAPAAPSPYPRFVMEGGGELNPRHPLAVNWVSTRNATPALGFSLSCADCEVHLSPEGGGVDAYWMMPAPPLVAQVDRGSPAAEAGFERGDRLIAIDGRELTSAEGGRRFANLRAGTRVVFTVERGARTLELPVSVPSESAVQWSSPATPSPTRVAPAPPSVAGAASEVATPVAPTAPDLTTLRYVGTINGTDIEVRGAPVIVREADGSIVIRGGGLEIRLTAGGAPAGGR